MTDTEQLYEALFDLENERLMSKKINNEADNLLKGLNILVDRFNEESILEEVASVLRNIVGCEELILLIANSQQQLSTIYATSKRHENIKIKPQSFFERIIKGDVSISFDIQSIPEWKIVSEKMKLEFQSAVHIGLKLPEGRAVLICCDSRPHFFKHTHADLIKRYSALITQALINIDSQTKIKLLNKNLVNSARQAGMAEIAINVLHSVGNVLNSLNISSDILYKKIRNIDIAQLEKLANFLKNDQSEEIQLFVKSEKGAKILEFLELSGQKLNNDKVELFNEVRDLKKYVFEVMKIIEAQQSNSKPTTVISNFVISIVIDSILSQYKDQLKLNEIIVIQEDKGLSITTDEYQFSKIVQNLIQNAIDSLYARHASENIPKKITISSQLCDHDKVAIEVADNGIGIHLEDINLIFNARFSTKHDHNGLGLHYSAITAKKLGGNLTVSSDGLGKGAIFKLIIPLVYESNHLTDNKDEIIVNSS